jgi:putative tryptophan/tyrosine transport system substrate-binding protein
LVTALRYTASLPNGGDLTELDQLKRRSFIILLGGAAAWPLAAQAQRAPMPVLGFLSSETPGATVAPRIAAFHQGLGEAGYTEGQNVAIEYRWAEGQNNRLIGLAADLVQRQVNAIVAVGGTPPALAAKAATGVIPILFAVGTDPIAFGLVASLNRPGGNLTGVTALFDEVAPKRLELLHELVPTSTVVALLANPSNPNVESQSKGLEQAARSLGLRMYTLHAKAESDIDAAFAAMAELRVRALLIGGDAFLDNRSQQIAALAARDAIPTMSFARSFPAAGGLMSYGGSFAEMYRLVGTYTGRILKGEKPADLPVMQVTKVELVINIRTAKALGLTVPQTLLVAADEVIE